MLLTLVSKNSRLVTHSSLRFWLICGTISAIRSILGKTQIFTASNNRTLNERIAPYVDSADAIRGNKNKKKSGPPPKKRQKTDRDVVAADAANAATASTSNTNTSTFTAGASTSATIPVTPSTTVQTDTSATTSSTQPTASTATSTTTTAPPVLEIDEGRALWPLVKGLVIRCNAEALASGAVLVDLPGLGDKNAARENVAKMYDKADHVWFVSPIKRAVTEKLAKGALSQVIVGCVVRYEG